MSAEKDRAYRILRAIRRIIRRVSTHSRWLLRETGLTVPQLLCLNAINELGPDDATIARLAEHVNLSPATISGIVDRLERAGSVVRERRSKDRRKVSVSLTDLGRRQVDELPTPLHERFVERLQGLDDAEAESLLMALNRIVAMMEAGELEAEPILDSPEDSDAS